MNCSKCYTPLVPHSRLGCTTCSKFVCPSCSKNPKGTPDRWMCRRTYECKFCGAHDAMYSEYQIVYRSVRAFACTECAEGILGRY
jgi:hypothetical protein